MLRRRCFTSPKALLVVVCTVLVVPAFHQFNMQTAQNKRHVPRKIIHFEKLASNVSGIDSASHKTSGVNTRTFANFSIAIQQKPKRIPLNTTLGSFDYCAGSGSSAIIRVVSQGHDPSPTNLTVTVRPSYTEQKSTACTTIRYMEQPGSVTALASFPGSGNTWVRHLLQLATGYFTGSIYPGSILKDEGFPAEGVTSGKVVAIKTHEYGFKCEPKFEKAILLVRHPAETILSELNRQASGLNHTGKAGPLIFKSRAWPKFVMKMTRRWKEFNEFWLTSYRGELLVVDYRDLKRDVSLHLRRMLTFLNVSVSDTSVECAMRYSEGTHHRPHSEKDNHMDQFTKTMIAGINAAIRSVQSHNK